ncbi:O-antigen ligase family protein [Stappia sp. F7233]|uniref:O-antigen ligase family protein n=1 Tax=Stappia albiluteola TaxID=2758565 RepID=A0A839AA79_9HYPH|nr:O-antigen ligase family protein [Stappia albiluteola]MBA5775934.1 O-antigen ligase family protein [Stappia albiluteola]
MSEATTDREYLRGAGVSARAGDGYLGFVPAIIIAYVTLLSPLFFVREVGDTASAASSGAGANLANQLFWVMLLFSVIVAGWRRLPRVLGVLRQPAVLLFLAFLALAFASIAWSPAPSIAFRRVMLQVIVLAAIVGPIFMAQDREAQLSRIATVFIVAVIVNMVAVVFRPAGPIGHEGIYAHKNQFGLIVAYAFIFCLYGTVRFSGMMRLLAMAAAAMALLELAASQSKTSLGLAMLLPSAALAVVGLGRLIGIRPVYVLAFAMVFALCGYAFASFLFDFTFEDLSLLLFDDTTFTGRTVIWDFIGGVIERRPFLGQGYGSFWGIGENSIAAREAPGFVADLLQAHNGYVDVTLETGFVGLGLLLALIVAVLFRIGRQHGNGFAEDWLLFCVVLFAVCHNMLESSWFRGYVLAWLLFVMAAGFSASGRLTKSVPLRND